MYVGKSVPVRGGYPQGPEEGVGSPGAGVIGVSHLPDTRAEN